MNLAIVGAALANLIHAFSCFIITALYLSNFATNKIALFSFLPETFALKHVKSYLRIGLPSIVLICLEWWGFEVLVLMSGVLSSTAVAAQTIVYNLLVLMQMIPCGLFSGCITIVGNSIGEQNVSRTKLAAVMGVTFQIIGCSMTVFIVWFCIHPLSERYTTDNDVIPVFLYTMPSVFICLILSGLNKGLLAILRALQKQS